MALLKAALGDQLISLKHGSANGLLQRGDKYTVGGLERKYC